MDLRQRLFQYRSFTPIPFLIAMIILAKPTLTSMLAGFFFVLAGESLRLWGVFIAGSETRTTDTAGGAFLITRGPFSYVCNPLYLGHLLIFLGIGIMLNVLWLALAPPIF